MTSMTETPMVDRVDRFRDILCDAIAETPVDQWANCAEAQRRTLRRIAETLHAVPDVTMHNLVVIDIATRGVVMAAIKVKLLAVGAGPTLDYSNATVFLNELQPLVDMVFERRIN
jgi:hypothetical protein